MSERLTAEREDYVRRVLADAYPRIAYEVFAELDAVRAERDEWKARYEVLSERTGSGRIGLAGMNFITNRERGSK